MNATPRQTVRDVSLKKASCTPFCQPIRGLNAESVAKAALSRVPAGWEGAWKLFSELCLCSFSFSLSW